MTTKRLKAFKYRLKPNNTQKQFIDDSIRICGLVYNLGLQAIEDSYKSNAKKSISFFDLSKQLTKLRNEFDFIKDVPNSFQQQSLKDHQHSFETPDNII